MTIHIHITSGIRISINLNTNISFIVCYSMSANISISQAIECYLNGCQFIIEAPTCCHTRSLVWSSAPLPCEFLSSELGANAEGQTGRPYACLCKCLQLSLSQTQVKPMFYVFVKLGRRLVVQSLPFPRNAKRRRPRRHLTVQKLFPDDLPAPFCHMSASTLDLAGIVINITISISNSINIGLGITISFSMCYRIGVSIRIAQAI